MSKNRNYWTKEKCYEVSKNFKTRQEFNKKERCVYITAYNRGWLDEICLHMDIKEKLTKEKCQEYANSCSTKTEFSKKFGRAFYFSKKNGWIHEICSHMKKINHWTKENCKKEASKYKTRKEFYQKCQSAYTISSKNKWLNEICSHMQWKTKPMYYWTREKCYEIALRCKTRQEFQNYGRPYRVAYENKWLDEMCCHMKNCGNLFKRMIYLYEFSDGHVYIGLTCDLGRRVKEHITDKNSSVYKYFKKSRLIPMYKELTEYLDINIASKLEKDYIKKYENLGYRILNKVEGGGLGGNKIKWTYKSCKEESMKYKNRTEFCKTKRRAYEKSKKEGWIIEFYPNSL